MRYGGPILEVTPIGLDFTRHRGRRPPQPRRDRPKRLATSNTPRDLLPLRQRQPQRTPLTDRDRTVPTSRNQLGPNRRWRPTKTTTDRPLRLPSLPPIPQHLPLRNRQPFHNTPPSRRASSKVLQRPLETTAVMCGWIDHSASLVKFRHTEWVFVGWERSPV